MYQTYDDLPDGEIKDIIAQYCYDYFFHYLLIQSDCIRLALCRYMSNDNTIQDTFVENSETYKPKYNGKKLVMDLVVRDDKKRYYNFEMQNYDIESDDEMRFTRYLDRLFDKQEAKGVTYDEMQDIFQLILYTGKPINNFEHYVHILKKGDFKYGVILEHQKAHVTLLQLRQMKEDINMEVKLSTINQLAYLFMNGKAHEGSEMSKEVNEAIEIHNKYMETDEVIKGYELERERMIIKTKMSKAKREGIEQGIEIGKEEGIEIGKEEGIEIGKEEGIEIGKEEGIEMGVKELIQSLYQIDASQWLKECTQQQLLRAFTLVGKHLSYEEFKSEMLK